MEIKHCYATLRNDIGNIRLKPDPKLQTQRPTKVHIHYRDESNTLSGGLMKKME